MKKFSTRVIAPLLTMAFIAGCGDASSKSPGSQGGSGMNMREAAAKADQLTTKTLSGVRPPLEWTHGQSDWGSCTGRSDVGDVTRRAVVMTQVSAERRGSLLGIIERSWKKAGYTITQVDSNKEFPAVYADDDEGVLKMALTVGYKGQFFLDVQTACEEKSEVAQPTTPGRGADYRGKDVPTPNVHSAFWSSEEPVPSPATSGG